MRFSIRKSQYGAWGVLAVAALMTTLLSGCGDPYFGDYATTKPNVQSLVGDWELKPGLSASANKSTKLTLRADGSFTAVNYPRAAVDIFESAESFLDGDGTWSVHKYQSYWVIEITWHKLGGKQFNCIQFLPILRNAPPHILHHTIGDPDSGEALVFEQVPGTDPT